MIRTEHLDAVATVVLSRPPVNAIDPAFVSALNKALDEIERAEPTAVVIRSDQKCFCAGADLSLIRGFFTEPGGVDAMVAYVKTLHMLFDRLESLEAVTLAVIDGPALGGGLELALSCDLRIASARSKIGLPEARVGMIPGARRHAAADAAVRARRRLASHPRRRDRRRRGSRPAGHRPMERDRSRSRCARPRNHDAHRRLVAPGLARLEGLYRRLVRSRRGRLRARTEKTANPHEHQRGAHAHRGILRSKSQLRPPTTRWRTR